MKRSTQMKNGNVPNLNKKSRFKGFRNEWKRTGPLIDVRKCNDLPLPMQRAIVEGTLYKDGYQFFGYVV